MAKTTINQIPLPLEGGTPTPTLRAVNEWLGPILNPLSLCLGVDRRPNEEWRRSITWPWMWASSEGRVASTRAQNTRPAQIITPYIHPNGYAYCRTGKIVRALARLVCDAHHGPAPFHDAVTRHLDGNPRNDRPENLAWGTQKDNVADAIRHGTLPRGSNHGRAKLTETDAAAILIRRHNGDTYRTLRAAYGVSLHTIRELTTGRTWRHVLPDLIRPDAETKARDATLPLRKRKTRERDRNQRPND